MTTRTAVVTGGTGGLGRALLPLLARRDMNIAATYLVPDEAKALEKEVFFDEERLMLRRVDATDAEATNNLMKDAADRFGGIHVLVNLVGAWAGGRDVDETDDVRFEHMVDINLRSAFYAIRAAVPYLRESGWGRIVTVASRAAVEPVAGQAAFNMAKAGVVALTKSVAQELLGTDITSNTVLPAVIDTPVTREAMPYADYVEWPTPEEIARVIDFLVSDESSVITGAAIPVFGST